MNNVLKAFAHQTLKDGLAQCTEGQQRKFRQMYAFKKPELSIEAVVDHMPDEKLDWAMQQVQRTLDEE